MSVPQICQIIDYNPSLPGEAFFASFFRFFHDKSLPQKYFYFKLT